MFSVNRIIIIIHEVLLPALHTCLGMHYKKAQGEKAKVMN